MKGVNPGKYRHRVEIQGPVIVRDLTTGAADRVWTTVWLDEGGAYISPDGQHLLQWTSGGSPMQWTAGSSPLLWGYISDSAVALTAVPAEVLTGPGRELIAAESKLAETSARINLRWFPALSAAWRILWDGHVYDIVSIETDITARREYRLRCKNGLSDGA